VTRIVFATTLVILPAVASLTILAHADSTPPIRLGSAEPVPAVTPVLSVDEVADYRTSRYEPAGFRLLGGDSDIGFQFGAVTTLTRFDDGVAPYLWNMDFVVAASVKDGPAGRSPRVSTGVGSV
jgi:hypothetical protein